MATKAQIQEIKTAVLRSYKQRQAMKGTLGYWGNDLIKIAQDVEKMRSWAIDSLAVTRESYDQRYRHLAGYIKRTISKIRGVIGSLQRFENKYPRDVRGVQRILKKALKGLNGIYASAKRGKSELAKMATVVRQIYNAGHFLMRAER